MPLTLTEEEVVTKIVQTIIITRTINDVERGIFKVDYKKILEDGSVYERGSFRVKGKEDIVALYAELDALIATGKTFEEASKELLYSKIAVGSLT